MPLLRSFSDKIFTILVDDGVIEDDVASYLSIAAIHSSYS